MGLTSSTSSQLNPSPVYPSGQGPHSTPSAVSTHISSRKQTPETHFGFTGSEPPRPLNTREKHKQTFHLISVVKLNVVTEHHVDCWATWSYRRPDTLRWCFWETRSLWPGKGQTQTCLYAVTQKLSGAGKRGLSGLRGTVRGVVTCWMRTSFSSLITFVNSSIWLDSCFVLTPKRKGLLFC